MPSVRWIASVLVMVPGPPPTLRAPATPPVTVMARANDNTRPAGTLRDGVLTVRLVARRARWHPADEGGIAAPADAFGEEGLAPLVPGPLLRAPAGTHVDATVRNALPETLVVIGLHERGVGVHDTLRVPPGATGRASFVMRAPGSYVYYGGIIVAGKVLDEGGGRGYQLVGAMIADAPNAPADRVFLVSFWNRLVDSTHRSRGERFLFLFNGKIWPYTDRFTYRVGDTVRWRVLEGSAGEHPLHLHGFYYTVDSRGDFEQDSVYDAAHRRLAITENLPSLGSVSLTWVPARAGNWVFHCHKAAHTSFAMRYALPNVDPPADPPPMHGATAHARDGMSGLMIGITVLPPGSAQAATAQPPRHRVRLLVQEQPGFYDKQPGFGYMIADGDRAPAPDSVVVPGPPLVLTRGEPAEITVVNHLQHPTAVHWHGIELESFYDGVAGWSGAGSRLAPMIAPRDSFIVRFTPPRAGTFIYHTHLDDVRQLTNGLYAPLIILEPGERWDPATDHVLMIGGARQLGDYMVALNGSLQPPPLQLRAGVPHRFRIISMTVDEDADVFLFSSGASSDSMVVTWRATAKDGATLPPNQSTDRPARLHIGPGETYDFAFTPGAGEMRVVVRSANTSILHIFAR
ncbi:MAG: multicopper oxidase domain-containing protein [Gemmatimonadota bacterium]|nr:multicopper oxidase domain-containing protein [Gemmatimonadota bacterium]